MKPVLTAMLAFGLLVSASAGHAGQVAVQGAVIAAEVGRFATVDRRAQIAPSAEFDYLKTLARRAGRVRVIVGLRVAFTPEGTLSPAARKAQQRAIASATAAVRRALSGTDHRVIHTYEFVPLIALELSTEALTRLQNSDLAATLWKDTPRPPPTLAQRTNMKAREAKAGGRGIAVAILDTGVDRTPRSLRRVKVVSEACFSDGDCPNEGNQQFGAGAAGRGVAGTGANLDGVAPGADIIAIQVFSHFTGTRCRNAADDPCALSFESDQIAGLEHVFRLRNTFTIGAASLSLGSGLFSLTCNGNPLKLAIDNLGSVRIPTVIGSGDDGVNTVADAPGCFSTAMTVGAQDKSNVTAKLKHTRREPEPLPDYIVTDGAATLLPSRLDYIFRDETGRFEWNHTTKNVGDGQEELPIFTGLKLEDAATSPILDKIVVRPLSPGEAKSGNKRTPLYYFNSFDYGTYKPQICADVIEGADNEENENNNCRETPRFYVVPRRLKGKVTGTWPTIEGATVKWTGTLTFDFKIRVEPATFVYTRVAGSLRFTVSGTTLADCTWSGTKTYEPSANAKIQLKFPGRYFAENILPRGFRIPASLTCPDPDGGIITVPAPINMGKERWMDTGGWKNFTDPGLLRLDDEFTGILVKFTWDLEASG